MAPARIVIRYQQDKILAQENGVDGLDMSDIAAVTVLGEVSQVRPIDLLQRTGGQALSPFGKQKAVDPLPDGGGGDRKRLLPFSGSIHASNDLLGRKRPGTVGISARQSGWRDSNPRMETWKASALPLGDTRVHPILHDSGAG